MPWRGQGQQWLKLVLLWSTLVHCSARLPRHPDDINPNAAINKDAPQANNDGLGRRKVPQQQEQQQPRLNQQSQDVDNSHILNAIHQPAAAAVHSFVQANKDTNQAAVGNSAGDSVRGQALPSNNNVQRLNAQLQDVRGRAQAQMGRVNAQPAQPARQAPSDGQANLQDVGSRAQAHRAGQAQPEVARDDIIRRYQLPNNGQEKERAGQDGERQRRESAPESQGKEPLPSELAMRRKKEQVRVQQDSIRRQVEEHQLKQLRDHQQAVQQQQQQQRANNNNNNINSDINAHRQPVPAEPPKLTTASSGVNGAGLLLNNHQPVNNNNQQGNNNNNQQGNNNNNQQGYNNNNLNNNSPNIQQQRPDDGNQKNANQAPDSTNNNNNNNNGLSDEFRRGLIKKVQGGGEDESNNLNNMPVQRNQFPPEQPIREIGGMHINWDWDDFSIVFQNYGGAEQKVRRAPHATTGEPWPLPQYYTKKDKVVLVLDPDFEFILSNNISCDILDQAVKRYKRRIVDDAMEDMYDNLQNAEGSHLEPPQAKYLTPPYQKAPLISRLSLKVRRPCTIYPSLEMDESYDLVVKKSAAYLWANEVWGLLRGLETLSQIVWRGMDNRLYVKESVISDYPRFPHRGILIDSSRHFIFKEVLYDMMDAMEMNKMNVLHWHIVDDQSFPYESQVFPELSAKGAFHPTFVYSLTDIADLVEYARMRGIRILPEFDSPGHTYSWGLSRPELLTQCYSGSSPVKGYLGPMDPVHNSTYRFLQSLFREVLHVFHDQYIHLGGDEVPLGCWQSNPEVTKFGEKLAHQAGQVQDQQQYFGGTSPNIRLVYEHYVNRVIKDIKKLGKNRNGVNFIMWQEVMNNDLKLPNDTLIQVWMGDMADVSRAISLGYNVLYSTCWYLDHVEYGVKWPKYYECDPVDNSYGYNLDEKKVKGGEAAMWAEYIDNENLIQTTWPRTSAVAERLWSSKDTRNLDKAGERLSEHRCRMLRRGLSVGQISGPDYCLKRGKKRGSRGDNSCQGAACKGGQSGAEFAADPDIQIGIRARGGRASECTWLFQVGGNVTLLALVAILAFVLLISLSRSSGKFHPLRSCRHRTILIVFLTVIVVYFMCYTTMWMHAFQFSGTFHNKRAESSLTTSS